MSDGPGRALLSALQRELVQSLHDAATVLDTSGLDADLAWADTPFAGRVRAVVADHPHPLLVALAALTSEGGGGAVTAALHGWRSEPDNPAASTGVAYAVRSADGLVAALVVVPSEEPQVTLHAAGLTGQTLQLPLSNGWLLRISGNTAGGLELAVGTEGGSLVRAATPGDRLEADFLREGEGALLGVPGGPSVQLGAATIGGRLWVETDGSVRPEGWLSLHRGEITVAPGVLQGLLPVDLTYPLDLEARVEPGRGFSLPGSPALRTRLAGSDVDRWLDLAADLVTGPDGSPVLQVKALTSLGFHIEGAPVEVAVEGLGLSLPVRLGRGQPPAPDPGGLTALAPTGANVALDLPFISGSGFLAVVGDDLAGGLTVRLPPMSATAFGLLSPQRGDRPLSFLVLMGATFPYPGVQVGYGFALSGIGGVVGVNRRIDRDALVRAITDGSAAQLLFPNDPERAGQAAVRALPSVFPAARGSVVAGPMYQLNWGGRIVTLSVAVLNESSTQVRLTILGKLVVAIPDPEAPLVFLQATFAGTIDPGEPSVTFVASLTGSYIIGASLSGDLLMLTRGGPDPTFVLSAGGFHPAFPVPRGVPALRRLSMDLSPSPVLDLRCEAYFAVTSNTLQLGARVELMVGISGVAELRGHLYFDALVQRSPFRFVADVSAGVSVRVFGETLVGIRVDLHLEGPAPWLARGRGSIDLFFFDVSLDFEVGWGSPAPALPRPPVDVAGELVRALSSPEAWTARQSAPPGVRLTAAAARALTRAELVDPYAALVVRQRRVPLGLDIDRFDGQPVPRQRWELSPGDVAPGQPAGAGLPVRDQFAPGQFMQQDDHAALSSPAFQQLQSGLEFFPPETAPAEERPVELEWESRVVSRDDPTLARRGGAGLAATFRDLELVMTAAAAANPVWWFPPEEVITVAPDVPVAAAFAWSMTPGPSMVVQSQAEMLQALTRDSSLMVVEAWEV